MARSIIIVNATQVVTSDAHPEGLLSVVTGFPQTFDSGVNGDVEQNMKDAKAVYHDQLSKNYANKNPKRVMSTVMLEDAYGVTLQYESIGMIPNIEPEPEPTPEPEPEPEPEPTPDGE